MPPKRKQIDETSEASTSTTRSTRASTRTSGTRKTSATGTTTKKSTSKSKDVAPIASVGGDEEDSGGAEPSNPTKKLKTSASTSTRKSATKGTTKRKSTNDDDQAPNGKISPIKDIHVASKPLVVDLAPPVPTKPPATSKKAAKAEPYTPQRALELFSKYADSDNANLIGPEGFEQLCTDANMPLDGPRPIIFAWQLGSKEMANITKEEWVKGTSTLKISSLSQISLAVTELENLLMQGKPPVALSSKKDQEYDRTSYLSFSQNTKAAFQKLYLFAFTLAKPEQSKNIDMETAVAFWTVLLSPKYPIMSDVIQFINEKGTYKATNKDLWSMMLEFCEVVSPSMDDYEADGAWPTLLDDFAAWKKSRAANGHSMDVDQ